MYNISVRYLQGTHSPFSAPPFPPWPLGFRVVSGAFPVGFSTDSAPSRQAASRPTAAPQPVRPAGSHRWRSVVVAGLAGGCWAGWLLVPVVAGAALAGSGWLAGHFRRLRRSWRACVL